MNDERRNAPRKPPSVPIQVVDTVSGQAIGRVGNLSRNGMMLICRTPLHDGALYQLRFELPGPGGTNQPVEAGVHTMWTDMAATTGHQWSGVRIISISGAAGALLDTWLGRSAD